ncbi:histidine kinase [Streptomyces sp. TRM 70361]|uniref:sensor histidine kinase n=1 Tax=Streptomyces sp. TRM 70361 TaxID=3116553 RepID=UPI002E7C19AC|nr:histidine kinase [Streptomyces sp. TRM 70361]MEE1940118.1 histidine kinase [Streptomyces sp. TRM 70361]
MSTPGGRGDTPAGGAPDPPPGAVFPRVLRSRAARDWLPPAALAVAQLLWWPLDALRHPGAAGAVPVGAGLLAVALTAVLLARRRRAPVHVLAAVTAVAAVAPSVSFPGALDVFAGAGAALALYTVAVRYDAPTALIAGLTQLCWQLVWSAALHGTGGGTAFLLVMVPQVAALGAGLSRRRLLLARRAAAARQAEAEQARLRAADDERHRLARELHDVSAHHLTSVVVSAEAARRLGASRPELTAEALRASADDGRATLSSLRELVAVMDTLQQGEPSRVWRRRIGELAAGFAKLGRPVRVELAAELPGPTGETVFGIVREALTNSLRHAPGSDVRVTVRPHRGVLEVVVDNDAPGGASGDRASGGTGGGAVRGLGSGRGLAGLRRRAAEAGGRLEAGPRSGGGWRVRAELPVPGTAPRGGRLPLPAGRRVAQVVVALLAFFNPLVPVLMSVPEERGPYDPAADALYLLLLSVHALPLLWRRRAPLAALAAALVSALLWPAAAGYGALPAPLLPALWAGAAVEGAVVYAVAAHGRHGGRARWTVPVAGCVLGAVVGATAAAGELLPHRFGPAAYLLLTAVAAGVLTLLFALVWRTGAATRDRRSRTAARERAELDATVRQAERAVRAQREHVAAGLREAVMARAERVVRHAEEGRLAEVAAEARAALAAMRELLATLHEPDREGAGSGTGDAGNAVPSLAGTAAGAARNETANAG